MASYETKEICIQLTAVNLTIRQFMPTPEEVRYRKREAKTKSRCISDASIEIRHRLEQTLVLAPGTLFLLKRGLTIPKGVNGTRET